MASTEQSPPVSPSPGQHVFLPPGQPISPPGAFSFASPDEWPRWKRRFERYRLMSGLHARQQDEQVNSLIYIMGDQADDILLSFQLDEMDSVTYDIVMASLDRHFIGKRNVIYERAKFNRRVQLEGESVSDFITAVHTLALHCDFGTLHDELLRDRIVVGVQDRALSEKMQLDPGLTLEKATAMARQSESIKKQQVSLHAKSGEAGVDSIKQHKTRTVQPDGDIRLCVDLTQLNKYIDREVYPLPVGEHVFGQLGNARYFSRLDANSGFWQFDLAPESQLLTTFITPFGRYKFLRLPFGISAAPEFFQKKMSQILCGLEGVVCNMDDILVYGSTPEEHNTRLRKVLERLKAYGITLNTEKCVFGVTRLKFLGHVLDQEGVRPDAEKVEAIVQMTPPSCVSELRSFMGMVT